MASFSLLPWLRLALLLSLSLLVLVDAKPDGPSEDPRLSHPQEGVYSGRESPVGVGSPIFPVWSSSRATLSRPRAYLPRELTYASLLGRLAYAHGGSWNKVSSSGRTSLSAMGRPELTGRPAHASS